MLFFLSSLQKNLAAAAQKAGYAVTPDQVHLERAKVLQHGHFACNLPLLLAKTAGKPPRQVAEEICQKLESLQSGVEDRALDSSWGPLLRKAEVAGPGFINLWVEQKIYTEEISFLTKNLDDYLVRVLPPPGPQGAPLGGRTMVMDFSHPNIAKPMGVHHLLSTIIGQSLVHLYRRAGWQVVADNFIGDMGTQFGKIIHAIKKWGNMQEIERDPIQALLKLYVQFHMEADKDVELDDEARAEYKKFEDGDVESRALWVKIRAWSLAEIQPLYDRLGISFDVVHGESFYEDKMAPILDRGRQQGIIVDGERGAWIIPASEADQVPVVIRKSDGATLYITRDLARTEYWEKTWHPDLMLTVVDHAQSFHFAQLFYAAEKLQLTAARNVHVAFGRMQFKDSAMSTRKGNVLMLSTVLDEAEQRAAQLVAEKATELSAGEQKELSRVLGIGAVKYNILSQNRTTNITFDWGKILSFEGNSAPYLMYTLTRARSVLAKSGFSINQMDGFLLQLDLEAEWELVLQILAYPEALERAVAEFKPNHIANFLYDLSQCFNHFYNGNSILQAPTPQLQHSRLLLVLATFTVMQDAFKLLGLEVPERM